MALILIVDDAAFARRMIRKVLQAEGYETLEAENGHKALDMLNAYHPDCILTDILMPDMNGFEFLKAVQSQELKTPIIVISADIQLDSRNLSLELGAAAFINKPLKADELLNTVQQVLHPQQ